VGVVAAINAVAPTYRVLGVMDDNPQALGRQFCGVPVLGGRGILEGHPQALVLAVPGRPENFRRRLAIMESLGLPSGRLATLVHPSAQLGPGVSLGGNCLVMAGVVLTAQVSLGDSCVVLPNSVVSHDTSLGGGCLVGSNVSISGGVTVEELCYLGSGCKIIQEVTIGAGSLVGLGAVVTKSCAPGSVLVGNPARDLSR
ncbi:MAG: acetyltransferase, partial [Desulfarculus sp.]|nr:acetyltransferase [Desulfarculus sp.]